MAHRIYHGKTGVVWNITQRAVGVLLKKQVGPHCALSDVPDHTRFTMVYS